MTSFKKRIRKEKRSARFFFFFLLLSSLFVILVFVAVPAILFREEKSSETTKSEISSEKQKLKDVAKILRSSDSPNEKKKKMKEWVRKNLDNYDIRSELDSKFGYNELETLYQQKESDESVEKKLVKCRRFKSFKALRVRGDGNCFFNAISLYLTGSQKKLGDKLRLSLVKTLVEREDELIKCGAIPDWTESRDTSPLNLLKQWTKTEFEWSGGTVELLILVRLLEREIIIVKLDDKPLHKEEQLRPTFAEKNNLQPIWLGFNNRNHYVLLLPPTPIGEIFNRFERLECYCLFTDNELTQLVRKESSNNRNFQGKLEELFKDIKLLTSDKKVNVISEEIDENQWKKLYEITELFCLLNLPSKEYKELSKEKKESARITLDNLIDRTEPDFSSLVKHFFEERVSQNCNTLQLKQEFVDKYSK